MTPLDHLLLADNLAFAHQWAIARKKKPMRCAPGVGWVWVTGRAKWGLPLALAPYMTGYHSTHRFLRLWPPYFRWYYRTEQAAWKALARALQRLKKEVSLPDDPS